MEALFKKALSLSNAGQCYISKVVIILIGSLVLTGCSQEMFVAVVKGLGDGLHNFANTNPPPPPNYPTLPPTITYGNVVNGSYVTNDTGGMVIGGPLDGSILPGSNGGMIIGGPLDGSILPGSEGGMIIGGPYDGTILPKRR